MNEQHAYKFVQSSDIAKNWHLHIYHRQYFCCPTPRSKNFWYTKIRGWGVCEICENKMLILLISTQKSYFCDNDVIFLSFHPETTVSDVATCNVDKSNHKSQGSEILEYQNFLINKWANVFTDIVLLKCSCTSQPNCEVWNE